MLYVVHCEWSPFEIGECSLPCGGGTRINTRVHDVSAEHGGEECEGPDSVEESCNTHECPGEYQFVLARPVEMYCSHGWISSHLNLVTNCLSDTIKIFS